MDSAILTGNGPIVEIDVSMSIFAGTLLSVGWMGGVYHTRHQHQ